ncbi:MAG TPA: GNAT family N-acetyltransferase [Candidatus Acidoferrum sp.]
MHCLNAGEADTADLARIQEKSDLQNICREELPLLSHGHFLPLHQHRAVKLPESYEAFFRGLSRKNRHELRRHEKILNNAFAGKQHIQCFRGEDELEEMAKEVDKISEKTYQRAIGAGFKPDDETLGFLRTAAHRGGLRGCVLYLEEQPCAFFIGNQYKNTFHANYMGFDPKFGKYSPGLSLLMHSIEDSFEASATRIDFGWGDRQYKRAICNEVWQDGPIYLYAFSLRGLTLNLLRSGTSFLDLSARKLLVKFSIFQRTKKSWQSWLQRSRDHNETPKPEPSTEELN